MYKIKMKIKISKKISKKNSHIEIMKMIMKISQIILNMKNQKKWIVKMRKLMKKKIKEK